MLSRTIPVSARPSAQPLSPVSLYGARLADRLERLLGGVSGLADVLVVGDRLPDELLCDSRARVERADGLPETGQWDVVCLFGILDNTPEAERGPLLRTAARLARHGVVADFAADSAEVVFAEELLAISWEQKHGRAPTWTASRPTRSEILTRLAELERPAEIFREVPLEHWFAGRLIADHLADPAEARDCLAELLEAPGQLPPSRCLAVVALSFDATSALSDAAEAGADGGDAADAMGACLILQRIHAKVFGRIEAGREREIDGLERSNRWVGSLRDRERTLRQTRTVPNTLGLAELIASPHLRHHADSGVWSATGSEAWFEVPTRFASGWFRVSLRVRRTDGGRRGRDRACVCLEYADGRMLAESLEWAESLSDELFLKAERPVVRVRFQPTDHTATYLIEEFHLEKLSTATAMKLALERKRRLLKAYRCTGRVFFRGAMHLLTGRWLSFGRKLLRGLPDSRLMRPDNDATADLITSIWKARGLNPIERAAAAREAEAIAEPPTVRLLLPLDGGSEAILRQTVESIRRQIWQHWELLVVITGRSPARVRLLVERYAATDDRVRVVAGPVREGLAVAAAPILAEYADELLAVLNSGYELAETALLTVAKTLSGSPDCAMCVNRPQSSGPADAPSDTIDTFRGDAAGQQLHLFRGRDILRVGFPETAGTALVPGQELFRMLRSPNKPTTSYADLVTYPCSPIGPVDPESATDRPDHLAARTASPVLVTGNIVGISGWDYVVWESVRGLFSLGMDLRLSAYCDHRRDLIPPHLLSRTRLPQPGDVELVIAPPHLLPHHRPREGCVLFTMWECDRVRPEYVEWMNKARLIAVPSQWGIDCFRASGVTVPMVKVCLGHDPLTFHSTSEEPEICTFGTAGALWGGGIRKNTARIIDLFEKAFPHQTDVRLRVKITPRCGLAEPADPRVEVLRSFLPPGRLADWYRSLTAYVNASAAEGFGLHLIEAMACGRPVVTANWSAIGEYFDESVGYKLDHRMTDATGDFYSGQWATPTDESIVEAMRTIYRDRTEARRRGVAASARAKQYTWKSHGRVLAKALMGAMAGGDEEKSARFKVQSAE